MREKNNLKEKEKLKEAEEDVLVGLWLSAFSSRFAVGKGRFSSYSGFCYHMHVCLGVPVFHILSAVSCLCICFSVLGLCLLTFLSILLIWFRGLDDGRFNYDGNPPLFFHYSLCC